MEARYGFRATLEEDDIDWFFGEALDAGDVEMYEYIVEYKTRNGLTEGTDPYNRSWHYYAMGEWAQSVKYWNLTLDDISCTSPQIFYYNFPKAVGAYLKLGDPQGAIDFLRRCIAVLPQYALEFNIFIAKTAIEGEVDLESAGQSLKYCADNFRENRYFKKDVIAKLGYRLAALSQVTPGR